mgnify:CR=1 FL=1
MINHRLITLLLFGYAFTTEYEKGTVPTTDLTLYAKYTEAEDYTILIVYFLDFPGLFCLIMCFLVFFR